MFGAVCLVLCVVCMLHQLYPHLLLLFVMPLLRLLFDKTGQGSEPGGQEGFSPGSWTDSD